MEPKILTAGEVGVHNTELEKSLARLERGAIYKNANTICLVPTRGQIPARVVQSWMGLMAPMNHAFIRIFAIGMEVGAAYSSVIEQIITTPDLEKFPYLLTLEEDNIPPPDGLLKLIESIQHYDAVGGLYWTKGEAGQPMCYGDPTEIPLSFMPKIPQPDTVQPCNGLGMGFTLFKIAMFRDSRFPRPFFKTVQEFDPTKGCRVMTQDLYFFEQAKKLGYRFACDSRVRVGHYSFDQDIVW